ncbi:MAG: hypothetical protein KDA37_04975, partial [Planctomycetales bacterium]|nr:hypothetical protein [Planctomycetales bacterium]
LTTRLRHSLPVAPHGLSLTITGTACGHLYELRCFVQHVLQKILNENPSRIARQSLRKASSARSAKHAAE